MHLLRTDAEIKASAIPDRRNHEQHSTGHPQRRGRPRQPPAYWYRLLDADTGTRHRYGYDASTGMVLRRKWVRMCSGGFPPAPTTDGKHQVQVLNVRRYVPLSVLVPYLQGITIPASITAAGDPADWGSYVWERVADTLEYDASDLV